MTNNARIKVAVIGGGASGWSAVKALSESGRNGVEFDVTIYEKENRWGGKCHTVIPADILPGDSGDGSHGSRNGVDFRIHELGAGAISGSFEKPSENYKHILKHLGELNLGLSLIEQDNRHNYIFFKRGKVVDDFSIKKLIPNFRQFLKLKYDLWSDYTSGIVEYKDILDKHPFLSQHQSHRYSSRSVLEVLAKAGQGYGYADMDDPYLTPPLVYFFDYIKAEQPNTPLYSVDNGMQGIWKRTAGCFQRSVNQKLNEKVTRIERKDSGIVLKTDKNGKATFFDKLIIATPLKQAQKFMDFDQSEQSFLNKVKYNHYVTVLCRARFNRDAVGWINLSNIINPSQVGQVVFAYRAYADSPWMTSYLYLPEETAMSDEEIVNRVAKSLDDGMNINIQDKEHSLVCHWDDYFAHLGRHELENGWYHLFDKDFQSKKHTLYVGTPLHMETVGHAVRYALIKTREAARGWIQEEGGNSV